MLVASTHDRGDQELHGEQGNDFRENDTISFMVGQVSVATATLAERVEGAHGDDGGDRFFYLTDLKVTE